VGLSGGHGKQRFDPALAGNGLGMAKEKVKTGTTTKARGAGNHGGRPYRNAHSHRFLEATIAK
jgi:hypothetical protein